jgi:GNAT superfamily N-acetyltransferase
VPQQIQISQLIFQALSLANLEKIHELFIRNERYYSMPLEYFERGTLGDEGFHPELSIIAFEPSGQTPLGCIIAVQRNSQFIIKCLLVECEYRNLGVGSALLQRLFDQAKKIVSKKTEIRFGDSPPRYWTPGVDMRHTSLVFFLEKNGFKRKGQRLNLAVDLSRFDKVPLAEKKGYSYSRLQTQELEQLQKFITSNFNAGWAREASLGMENDPPTTFVAKNSSGEFVGFASCDLHFPGSFGPTGVKKSIRGGGIGGELLRWCCYTQKEKGIKETVIQWVGPTKFYSKIADAYMAYHFYVMKRKL